MLPDGISSGWRIGHARDRNPDLHSTRAEERSSSEQSSSKPERDGQNLEGTSCRPQQANDGHAIASADMRRQSLATDRPAAAKALTRRGVLGPIQAGADDAAIAIELAAQQHPVSVLGIGLLHLGAASARSAW
ncbi:hypothetical protein CLCR_02152 [Cladophialophora carrionii]|uniref:Uncharacterized protein n=1 Tax=Cladophialophora carrionii TaxID=86049 RepID=A0A1C1CE92_9EURO|nr:hypothetical protein CLCR_02152 [Cladophialophora carrionii]